MKRKAWLAILFSLVMLVGMLSLTACDKKEKEEKEKAVEEEAAIALPLGLKFGMTYDDFCDAVEAGGLTAPALDAEEDEDDYFSDGVSLPLDDPSVWDFIKSDYLKRHASGEEFDPIDDMDFYITRITYSSSRPTLYASFNQAKELYEIYVAWDTYDEDFAAVIMEDIAETYNAIFGTDGIVDDYAYEWESNRYGISLEYKEYLLYLVIHDKAHDLDS